MGDDPGRLIKGRAFSYEPRVGEKSGFRTLHWPITAYGDGNIYASAEDLARVKELVTRHLQFTGSDVAEKLLADWAFHSREFVQVMPVDYKKVLLAQKAAAVVDEPYAVLPAAVYRESEARLIPEAKNWTPLRAADRDAYLKLAGDLEGFLAQLRSETATASTGERRRVLKLLVKDVLIGPEKITIRHRIPARANATGVTQRDPQPDTEGDHRAGCQVRWGRDLAVAGERLPSLCL